MCDSSNKDKSTGKTLNRQGILHRLHLRELYGIGGERKRALSYTSQFFTKLPRRLAFKLSDLVSESILQSGHVFLGFTKDGQFVLSYTFQIETGDHSYFYQYRYKLHWWQFVPYKPLKKVYETKLFGDQDISRELKLAVCQWPTDDTKLLIYGCCYTSVQDNLHCYLTITANPPLAPCKACSALRNIPDLDEEDRVHLYEDQPGCFRHQFSVHTRFFLVPPFPAFSPHVCMLKDNSVLVNTGDNLIVLTVSVESPPPPPPSSQQQALCDDDPTIPPSPLSVTSSSCSEDFSSSDAAPGSPCCDISVPRVSRKSRLATEDLFVQSPPPLSPHCELTAMLEAKHNNKQTQASKLKPPLSSFSQSPSQKWDDPKSSSKQRKDEFYVFSDDPKPSGKRKTNKGTEFGGGEDKRKRIESVKENISPALCRKAPHAPPPSENSGTSEKKCVTEVTQWFLDTFPSGDRQNEEGEEEYHQILPLDVHGTSSFHMKALSHSEASLCKEGELICAHQMSLDIERFAHETAQQLCAEAGRRFLAFNDYDVGIIDLCPLTHTAFCLVFMLIHATIGKKGVAKALRNAERKEFQTSFRFTWNIKTGSCAIVDKDELREYDPYSVYGTEGHWSPAQQTIKALHKERLLPRCPNNSVNVLTNASVFKGSSLKVLWAPQHNVAIVL